ncbi:MAG: hypothetical protein V3T70_05435 [Phycisphaerae bacterium]
MRASGILEVKASVNVVDDAAVHGQFNFSATSGTQPILRPAAAGVTLDGLFEATGSVGGALDRAASTEDVQLLSGGEIRSTSGPIVISLPFENDGIVTANGTADTYDITFNLSAIKNGSVGTFQVTATNSELIFNHTGSPSLSGDADFDISAGLMHFKNGLTTAGGFRHSAAGSLKVKENETFRADGNF